MVQILPRKANTAPRNPSAAALREIQRLNQRLDELSRQNASLLRANFMLSRSETEKSQRILALELELTRLGWRQ